MKVRAELLLVRHTETNWNKEHRYSGQSNKPTLTHTGLLQARRVAQALSAKHCAALYCSDLRRCWRTARIIGRTILLKPVIEPRLREAGLGDADGLLKSEVRERFCAPELSTRHPDFDFTPIGGESRAGIIRRQRQFLDDCVNHWGVGGGQLPVLIIVGHGTSLRVLCEDLNVDPALEQGEFKSLIYETVLQPLS